MRRIIIFSILFLGLAGGGYGLYLFNKPLQNLDKKKAELLVQSEVLYSTFEENEENANATYIDKVIEVKGKVYKVEKNENGTTIFLEAGSLMGYVLCEMDPTGNYDDINEGTIVVIKGICTGYLMDVVLSRSVVVK